jgi:hypothetical protein
MDAEAVRRRLEEAIEQAGSLIRWSAENNIPASVVSNIRKRKREPTPQVLRALGFVLVKDYQQAEGISHEQDDGKL